MGTQKLLTRRLPTTSLVMPWSLKRKYRRGERGIENGVLDDRVAQVVARKP